MAIFVVMEPPARPGPSAEAVFVRDGFAVLGFLLPYFWLFWHRLWIEGLLALGVVLLLAALGEQAGFATIASLLTLLASIYVGLEGSALRVNALRRRGWREAGVVVAASRAEAEIRYFADDAETPAMDAVPLPWAPAAPVQSGVVDNGPALGLLSYPGGR
jgi:hypothetical protein